jgi:apolipoprotein N-acyltransferase
MDRETQQVLTASRKTSVVAERESAASAEPRIRNQKSRILLPVSITAGLLWASYFPMDLGWLGWLALVPFLVLVRTQAPARRAYWGSFFAGLLFYLPSLQWMRVADDRMYLTWVGLAVACALFFPVALFLVRRLEHRTRLPLIVTFPAVWTALEYLRAHLFTGFPWYFLAHTQHSFLPIIQVTDLTGAYGVTFLVAGVNALLFEMVSSRAKFRSWFGLPDSRGTSILASPLLQAGVVFGLAACVLAYGSWRLGQEETVQGPMVGLIQGNLDQAVRLAASANGEDAASTMIRHYRDLTDQAIVRTPKPDLLVWPETSYPHDWWEIAPGLAIEQVPPEKHELYQDWLHAVGFCRSLAKHMADRWHTDLLLGLNGSVLPNDLKPIRYNTAILIKADGQVAGRYDKIHRVPFGEYVPFKDWLPFMNKLAPYDFDYSVHAGERFTRFTHGEYRFGVLICYEDTDPSLARQYLRGDTGGAPVDFFLNISNDGWFHGTSEHEEHLAICRFRAIECRRAVARAVNMGISAVIDGNGRMTALPGANWAGSKKIATVLKAKIPIDDRISLYAKWGDWFPWTCWAVIAAGMLWAAFWPRPAPRTMLG